MQEINVLSILLNGSECWKMTHSMVKLFNIYQTKGLRIIKGIFWLNLIRNIDLLRETCMIPTSVDVE
jgi:hypothetical protein